jgi:hypothetical protein
VEEVDIVPVRTADFDYTVAGVVDIVVVVPEYCDGAGEM